MHGYRVDIDASLIIFIFLVTNARIPGQQMDTTSYLFIVKVKQISTNMAAEFSTVPLWDFDSVDTSVAPEALPPAANFPLN